MANSNTIIQRCSPSVGEQKSEPDRRRFGRFRAQTTEQVFRGLSEFLIGRRPIGLDVRNRGVIAC